MKIRNRITYIFLIQFIIIAITVGFLTGIISWNILENEIFSHLETTVQSRGDHIETFLEENIAKFKLITSRTKLRNTLANYNQSINQDDIDVMQGVIKDAKESVPEIERICIFDLQGNIIISTNESFLGRNGFRKEFYISGREKEDIFFSYEDGEYKIFISGPLVLDDQLLGVAVSVLKIDYLNYIVTDQTGLKGTGEILVAKKGSEGEPVFLTERLFEPVQTKELREENKILQPMEEALNKEIKHFENATDYRGKKVLAVTSYSDLGNLGLVGKIDKKEAFNPVYSLMLVFVLIALGFIFIYYFTTRYFSSKITKPIEKLKKGTEIIKAGNLDHQVGNDLEDEIGELSRSFDEMTLAIKKSRAEVDKKVEEQTREIREQKNKIETILYSIGDGVFVVDLNDKIILLNKVAADLSGYSIKEAEGKNYQDVFKFVFEETGKRNDQFIKKAISSGEIQEMGNHTVLITKDRREIPVADSASPLKNKKGEVVGGVVIFRDVSKEKAINQMKNEFVSVVSHQLRTPLTAIRLFIEMLSNEKTGDLNKKQKEYLKDVEDSTKRMIKLVNNLLNISRLESGRLKVQPKPIKINKFIQEVIDESSPLLDNKKGKIVFNKLEEEKTVSLDPVLMRQVFHNLIINAIKYSRKDSCKITVSLKEEKENYIFIVEDQGVGIPKEKQTKVFNKFFRADNAKKIVTDGTGLGLYVSKMVIDAVEGKIWFESEGNDQGSTFYVSFPKKGMKEKKEGKTLELNI